MHRSGSHLKDSSKMLPNSIQLNIRKENHAHHDVELSLSGLNINEPMPNDHLGRSGYFFVWEAAIVFDGLRNIYLSVF